MTVSGMLSSLSSHELTEWKAYFRLKERMEKEREDKPKGQANKQATF